VWVLLLVAGSTTMYAGPTATDQPPGPRPPRLGPPPSLTPAQVRAQSTAPRAGFTPRAPGQSRAEVVNLFNNQFFPALLVPPDWTGNTAGCVPGSTSAAFEAATVQMVNYFRTMAGLPTVTLDAARTPGAQSAALMMAAQGDLSHNPPPGWACRTQAGADAAGRSNLSLGSAGADAMRQYMQDTGVDSLGHRRWIIFPPEVQIGTGSTDFTNALDVVGGPFGQRTTSPEFVAWPPPGFVPYSVVYPTWSFAYPDANFTNATVTLASQGIPVAQNVTQLPINFGDNGVSWVPQGLVTGAGVADLTVTVSVNNVLINGTPRNFSYTMTIIDPNLTPPTPPTPPFTCSPRPRPTVSVAGGGPGQIVAPINVAGTGNVMSSVRFGQGNRTIANATVNVQGIATGVTSGQTVALPASTTQIVLTVGRAAPGAVTVPFALTDGCGEWPSFVGMGANVP
jgi:uncharacterized protein YkwD